MLAPEDQSVFAVVSLWQDWPAWAVAALTFGCHILVLTSLVAISWRHFQDLLGGMAAATFYLLMPYTGLYVGQLHHVLPMALFLGSILLYRHPMLAGGVLGVATAATYFPALVLPIWLGFYRGRGLGRFLTAFLFMLVLGLGLIGTTLWLNGQLEPCINDALSSPAFQPWREPTTEGFWSGVLWAYRIPVFVIFLAFVVLTMFWPSPKNLAHVIALCAATIISLQWWLAEQGGMYTLWYMPLMLLMVFRPNLNDRFAVPIDPQSDWLTRSRRWSANVIRRILRRPIPVEQPNPA
jgi:hypothetical protein